MKFPQEGRYYPFIGPCDPCPPIRVKFYSLPPNLFITFQPPGLPQFSPAEALRKGTLWPALYSPYVPNQTTKGGGVG
ncbi:spore coat associated protein CotJA [Paenibacillus sp. FSL K6-1230]|uniref:spore coat associated protein CotJA n=1 Tax=Paenibacillus sp. FSL K6-1230 TaxID=2921603 RepID=UPI00039DC3BD